MSLADLPWIHSEQRPHGVLAYDSDHDDWVDASGASDLGETQPVTADAEFEVSFVVPGNVEPSSELLDEAFPELSMFLGYGFEDVPSVLMFDPSMTESDTSIKATWSGGGDVAIEGLGEAAGEFRWSPDQLLEVERWIASTVALARRLEDHIMTVADRVAEDITAGLTVSMPFGDTEVIEDGYMATILLPTDVDDDQIDAELVRELGEDGARAWTSVSVHFATSFLMEACGYFGFDIVDV